MSEAAREGGYSDWLDAVAAGEGYYLECANGHGATPPREVCRECGSTDLQRQPLAEAGTVETFTTTHVATPDFADDAPYVVAIADFGPVRLTGRLPQADPEDVEVGLSVGVDVEETVTTGERGLVFRPR